jgi:hypothetical protein
LEEERDTVSTVTRTWLAFAALGTGMIHLALVISSPLPIAAILLLLGLVEFAWGVLTFIRERISYPRWVLFGALLPILLWGLLAAAATALEAPAIASSLGLAALGFATVLELFVAVVLAVQLRRGVDFSKPSRMPSPVRYLSGLLVGGLVVAALTTPALAATEAGVYAQPHGEHSDSFVPRVNSTDTSVLNLPEHPGH